MNFSESYKYQELLKKEKDNGNLYALLVMICGKRFANYKSMIDRDHESFELQPTYLLESMEIKSEIIESDNNLQLIQISVSDIPVQTITLAKNYPASTTNVCQYYAEIVDTFFKTQSYKGYRVVPKVTNNMCAVSFEKN